MSDNLRTLAARRLRAFPGSLFEYPKYIHRTDIPWQDQGFTPQLVELYLSLHPQVVENFVNEHISQETLERWLEKKKATLERNYAVNERRVPAHDWFTGDDINATQRELLRQIFDNTDYSALLYQVASLLSSIVRADKFNLYLYQNSGNDLVYFVPGSTKSHQKASVKYYGPVTTGATVAAYVAKTLQPVWVEDVIEDERFPKGVGKESHLRNAVICLPLVMPSRDPLCVMEFLRHTQGNPFTMNEYKLATGVLAWIGTTFHQCQVNRSMVTQIDLNEFLLEIAKVIFGEPTAVEKLVEMIMVYTKTLVNADRCSFFLLDDEKKELYATLFDEGVYKNGKPVFKRREEIRFPADVGLAGYVVKTCEIVNIKDAYQDKRFNKNIDVMTGYTTKHILCMPIISAGKAMGVVQMVNKRDNLAGFTKSDESAFKMFAVYCALAIHFSKMMNNLIKMTAKHGICSEELNYLSYVPDEELRSYLRRPLPDPDNLPKGLGSFFFCPERQYDSQLSQLYMHLMISLFTHHSFDLKKLSRFVLSVKRNYRSMPYHNWRHGWLVTHCMYSILTRIKDRKIFPEIRLKALMVATLCHDVDHRGVTNDFVRRFKEPLSVLYEKSFNENHHLEVTMRLLQLEGNEIFANMPDKDYKQLVAYIGNAILATDLLKFLKERKHLKKALANNTLDLQDPKQLDMIIALLMTVCDLGSNCFPWHIQRELIGALYEEFFAQGDLERKQGNPPIPMFDRDFAHLIPHNQTEFLKNVVIPNLEMLIGVFPEMDDIMTACKENLAQWESVARNDVWEPVKSHL